MEKSTEPSLSTEENKESGGGREWWWILLIAFIILFMAGLGFILVKKMKNSNTMLRNNGTRMNNRAR
jgi:flagellar basal body-associated protein FliL